MAEVWKLNIHTYEEVFDILKNDDTFIVKTSKAEYKPKISS